MSATTKDVDALEARITRVELALSSLRSQALGGGVGSPEQQQAGIAAFDELVAELNPPAPLVPSDVPPTPPRDYSVITNASFPPRSQPPGRGQ